MVQVIVNHKKFGPIPLGNPEMKNYPKHPNLVDALNDLRVVGLDLSEVRTQTKFKVSLTRDLAVSSDVGMTVPREYQKVISTLEGHFRSEKNPKPRIRLDAYTVSLD